MFNTQVIENIKNRLISLKQRICVAESVTAGLLQAALASAENASEFFEGGITAYNIDQKVKHLGIDKEEGDKCNCVSSKISDQMAIGVCRLFDCEWGVSITGYATPVPEAGHRLYAYFAICNNGEIVMSERINLEGKEAEEAQLEYVNVILEKFEKILVAESTSPSALKMRG